MIKLFKYFAFISYSSKDIKWGKRLHQKLTQFRMPSVLCSEKEQNRKPIQPVFFAPYDIQPGELPDELKGRLKASKYLIVICSPNSAKSEWVGKEIEYFCSINKKENVFFFIIDGEPNASNSERECYNPILKKAGFVDPLGVNVNEKIYTFPFEKWNVERAYIQLITKLLGIDFDVLWNHHKHQLRQQFVSRITGLLLFIGLIVSIVIYYQPVDVKLNIHEQTFHNSSLPPISNLKINVAVGEYSKTLTLSNIDSTVVLREVPRKYLGEKIVIKIKGENCIDKDTIMKLNRTNSIFLSRDIKYYGHIKFVLRDKDTYKPIPNESISINGIKVLSDGIGLIECFIPVAKQRKEYIVQSSNMEFEDSLIQPPFFSQDHVVLAKRIKK